MEEPSFFAAATMGLPLESEDSSRASHTHRRRTASLLDVICRHTGHRKKTQEIQHQNHNSCPENYIY